MVAIENLAIFNYNYNYIVVYLLENYEIISQNNLRFIKKRYLFV